MKEITIKFELPPMHQDDIWRLLGNMQRVSDIIKFKEINIKVIEEKENEKI